MNYIYDITLNFNEDYYDFYEWDNNDEIDIIKKIPIFCVEKNSYYEIKENDISFDSAFINEIKNKTECYSNNGIKYMTSFLITDKENIMAIKLENKVLYSSLQINDELDILETLNLNLKKINYEIIKRKENNGFKTRLQVKQSKKAKEVINRLFYENDIDKIRYFYYECFNKKENNIKIIKEKFKSKIDDNEIVSKIENILNTTNYYIS